MTAVQFPRWRLTVLERVVVIAIITMLGIQPCNAGPITTSNYTQITNAVFIDLPGVGLLSPVSVAGVTVSTGFHPDGLPNFHDTLSAYGGFPTLGPNDPGDGYGYSAASNIAGFHYAMPLVLNFSQPVAAFGVTFYHQGVPYPSNEFTTAPALLKVFDGPDATGNLLGTILSSGYLNLNPFGNPDFVGVWSDSTNIRSASLVGTGPNERFAVDGYGLSLTPNSVPEPGTFVLVSAGCLGLLVYRRWRNKSLPSQLA